MKVFLFTLLFVAGALARSTVQKQSILAEGPKCPIADPLTAPGPIPLNVTLDPVIKLDSGSEASNLIAEGLSGLKYTINVNIITLAANFEVTIESVTGNATYAASGYLDASPMPPTTIPAGNFTGSGLGKVSATGLRLKGRAVLFVNLIGNKVTVRTLTLETVSFDSLSVDLGSTFEIGGENVDWDSLNANIKENFDRDFAQHKNALTERIRVAANSIIGNFTLAELIELINNPPGQDC